MLVVVVNAQSMIQRISNVKQLFGKAESHAHRLFHLRNRNISVSKTAHSAYSLLN